MRFLRLKDILILHHILRLSIWEFAKKAPLNLYVSTIIESTGGSPPKTP